MANSESLSSEIEQLEARLATKKQELVDGNNLPEKAVLRDVIKEHSGSSSENLGSQLSANPVTSTTAPRRPISDNEKKIVEKLISHAFDHGISSAVKKAHQTGDAFFIDFLHDQLVDEYYDKMITARKINPS